jgi:hypothetical protein
MAGNVEFFYVQALGPAVGRGARSGLRELRRRRQQRLRPAPVHAHTAGPEEVTEGASSIRTGPIFGWSASKSGLEKGALL